MYSTERQFIIQNVVDTNLCCSLLSLVVEVAVAVAVVYVADFVFSLIFVVHRRKYLCAHVILIRVAYVARSLLVSSGTDADTRRFKPSILFVHNRTYNITVLCSLFN